jgi:hypothetical protein
MTFAGMQNGAFAEGGKYFPTSVVSLPPSAPHLPAFHVYPTHRVYERLFAGCVSSECITISGLPIPGITYIIYAIFNERVPGYTSLSVRAAKFNKIDVAARIPARLTDPTERKIVQVKEKCPACGGRKAHRCKGRKCVQCNSGKRCTTCNNTGSILVSRGKGGELPYGQ